MGDIAVVVGLLINFGGGVWWASKITAKMDAQTQALVRLDKELEKRDTQMAAAWKKIDRMNERLTVVETKVNIHNHEEA